MNQMFAIAHVTGYVNVLITQRLSLSENLVIGRYSAVNGAPYGHMEQKRLQIEKVEYVNMRPTIAGLGAGCALCSGRHSRYSDLARVKVILWQGARPTIQVRVRSPWPTSPALLVFRSRRFRASPTACPTLTSRRASACRPLCKSSAFVRVMPVARCVTAVTIRSVCASTMLPSLATSQ